jgi:predicted dehydrogenase
MSEAKLGFLGVGWIGRQRMRSILDTGRARAVAIADPSPQMAEEARRLAPEAKLVTTIEDMLELGADGVVIATPSALHAEQAIRALKGGGAVFCQKPLGRNAGEVRAVVDAARAGDLLLGVDLSYRFSEAMRSLRKEVQSGALGRIHAAELVFHNAYGPDKPWFYDPELSGGGCVMDLGVHLVDLALWTLDEEEARVDCARLLAGGEPHESLSGKVEDYAVALLQTKAGVLVQLACSWRLQAGAEAVIRASFYGSDGGAAFRNVGGSFYDFTAERYRGTSREILASPPDDWSGRAAADWAVRLAQGEGFDPQARRYIAVARVLDQIYAGDGQRPVVGRGRLPSKKRE